MKNQSASSEHALGLTGPAQSRVRALGRAASRSALRIGILAPPWVPVPPPAYGGTEAVIDNLARSLQARGHDVRLFTVGESTCPVPRDSLFATARVAMGDSTEEAAHVLAGYDALADMDIIHDHTVLGPLIAATRPHTPPVVVTHHTPFTSSVQRVLQESTPAVSVVAISHSPARSAGPVPIRSVIHHGLDLQQYQPGPGDGQYLAFIGRMSPDKGVDTAVRVAKRAGLPLMIASKMRTTAERAYFSERVAPLLDAGDPQPEEMPLQARIELLQRATALVNPIRWPEPFGLVMIEALAAGTPVIGRAQGASPEIIEDGRTGFLCDTEDEMVAAVSRVNSIDRRVCRAIAVQRFSADRMARDYEDLYGRILATARHRRPAFHVGSNAPEIHSWQRPSALDVTG